MFYSIYEQNTRSNMSLAYPNINNENSKIRRQKSLDTASGQNDMLVPWHCSFLASVLPTKFVLSANTRPFEFQTNNYLYNPNPALLAMLLLKLIAFIAIIWCHNSKQTFSANCIKRCAEKQTFNRLNRCKNHA